MSKIAKALSRKVQIEGIGTDVLEYVFFIMLSQMYYLTICLLVGTFLDCMSETVAFFLAFTILRRYAGGMHATTEYRCMAISAGLILLSVASIEMFTKIDCKWFWIPVSISFVLITILAPVESIEKPLSAKRRKINNFKSSVLASVGLLAVVFCQEPALRYSIGIAVVDESVFLVLGKVREGKF